MTSTAMARYQAFTRFTKDLEAERGRLVAFYELISLQFFHPSIMTSRELQWGFHFETYHRLAHRIRSKRLGMQRWVFAVVLTTTTVLEQHPRPGKDTHTICFQSRKVSDIPSDALIATKALSSRSFQYARGTIFFSSSSPSRLFGNAFSMDSHNFL